jgi:hypothetical protein
MAESCLISIFLPELTMLWPFSQDAPPSDYLIASTASDQWIRLGAGGVD